MPPATRRAMQREQRENTRSEVLSAAEAFLREHPYRELSIETVMERTGLTRTAFYRHFDDVPDLVLRLLGEVTKDLYLVGERWAAAAGEDFPAPALAGLSGIVEFFARHGPLLRAIAEAAATDEQVEQGYLQLREAFIDMTASTLDRLSAEGQLQVPDTRAMARALCLMNEAFLLEEFGRQPQADPETVLAIVETIWLRVLGPRDPVG